MHQSNPVWWFPSKNISPFIGGCSTKYLLWDMISAQQHRLYSSHQVWISRTIIFQTHGLDVRGLISWRSSVPNLNTCDFYFLMHVVWRSIVIVGGKERISVKILTDLHFFSLPWTLIKYKKYRIRQLFKFLLFLLFCWQKDYQEMNIPNWPKWLEVVSNMQNTYVKSECSRIIC